MQVTDILLRRGWVNAAQLDEVGCDDRSEPATCIESLLRLGHLARERALEALSAAFEIPVVDLSKVTIDSSAVALLDGSVAWRRRVLPFGFETDGATINVACLDPNDPNLSQILRQSLGERHYKLHVALKTQLEAALLNNYRDAMTGHDPETSRTTTVLSDDEPQSRLLMVGPPSRANQHLAHALAEVYDRVVFVNTTDEALAELEERIFAVLLINATEPGQYLTTLRRFRAGSPSGQVKFFSDVRYLATAEACSRTSGHAGRQPWTALVEAVMATDDDKNDLHSSLVALADHLAHRLGLPEEERWRVMLAAHLYGLRSFRTTTTGSNCDDGLSELADELGLDAIMRLIEHDTIRLSGQHPSFDRVAADIIAQITFCQSRWERLDALNPDQFETVKAHLTSLAGRRFLPDIVSAWIEVLRDGIGLGGSPRKNSHVVLLNDRGEDTLMLQPCLENLDFQVTAARTIEQVLPLFTRQRPDMILVLKHGPAGGVRDLIGDLTARGVPIDELPTFVLAERPTLPDLTGLLKAGVEEIMPLDGDLDPLLVKMCRTRSRLEQESTRRLSLIQHVGTHGTLEDMNVVDLLQAMGMSDKTVRLSITAHGSHLSMFLDHGRLIFAECDDRQGAEAVFAGLAWTRGVWSVDPVGRDDLPEPNNDRSIDSILIEGCCLIDERLKDNAPDGTARPESFLVEADQ